MTQNNFDLSFKYKTPDKLPEPKIKGHAGPPPGQGPFIAVYLSFDKEKINDSTFQTYGCPACINCSKTICELAIGLTFEQAQQLDKNSLIKKIGQLPRAKRHCFDLAIRALRDALGKIQSIYDHRK